MRKYPKPKQPKRKGRYLRGGLHPLIPKGNGLIPGVLRVGNRVFAFDEIGGKRGGQ